MGKLKNIVHLSKEQLETLLLTGKVTADGITVNYTSDDVHVIPIAEYDKFMTTNTQQVITGAKDFRGGITVNGESIVPDLSNFVTLDGAQYISGEKRFTSTFTVETVGDKYVWIDDGLLWYTYIDEDGTGAFNIYSISPYAVEGQVYDADMNYSTYSLKFPRKSGTFATTDDIINMAPQLFCHYITIHGVVEAEVEGDVDMKYYIEFKFISRYESSYSTPQELIGMELGVAVGIIMINTGNPQVMFVQRIDQEGVPEGQLFCFAASGMRTIPFTTVDYFNDNVTIL